MDVQVEYNYWLPYKSVISSVFTSLYIAISHCFPYLTISASPNVCFRFLKEVVALLVKEVLKDGTDINK